ncbi:hypothetical protein T440DRAFT_518492 [Plenodomus tracheiphilus IPT5]|uniref:Uncharacterized protein n=1 Tax=Plenodomus tracheiphilus IPT5 TaxID=1408161 RepID=A0A6A7B7P1_9PLEO|nr:hypothetical protein T440DRAFT_518492 [Plenodomus tracheiphilus IPT5]
MPAYTDQEENNSIFNLLQKILSDQGVQLARVASRVLNNQTKVKDVDLVHIHSRITVRDPKMARGQDLTLEASIAREEADGWETSSVAANTVDPIYGIKLEAGKEKLSDLLPIFAAENGTPGIAKSPSGKKIWPTPTILAS